MNTPLPRLISHCHRLLALALCLPAALALAHDTWFAPVRGAPALLALGTGDRFPMQQFPLGMEQLRLSGCRTGDGAVQPLRHAADTPTALHLRAPRPARDAGLSCWAQTEALQLELGEDKVALYLKEIQAPRRVHDAWAGLRSRGQPWLERYSKHARIEIPARGAMAPQQPAQASGMALDLLLDTGTAPLHAGDELSVQVLRDGQPLPDLPLELHGDRSPLGLWKRSDGQGRVRFKLPLSGRWVLRGTDLRLSDTVPDTWESRFVTLALEVAPARAPVGEVQNGSNSRLKTRSTHHSSASAAISTEPPTNTPWR